MIRNRFANSKTIIAALRKRLPTSQHHARHDRNSFSTSREPDTKHDSEEIPHLVSQLPFPTHISRLTSRPEIWPVPQVESDDSEFVHEALPTADSIRLLRVKPGHPDSRLEVEIRTVNGLTNAGNYMAVSYTWQNPWTTGTEPQQVLINGRISTIRADLCEFLKVIRGTSSNEEEFWIDAICLNQKDRREVMMQIPRTSSIYYHAKHVVIWLGCLDMRSLRGLVFMEYLMESIGKYLATAKVNPEEFTYFMDWEPEELYELLDMKDPGLEIWADVRYFFTRPWFSRLWIIQEYIMAKDSSFLMDVVNISSETFSSFCLFIHSNNKFSKLISPVEDNTEGSSMKSFFEDVHIFFNNSDWRDKGPLGSDIAFALPNMTEGQTWLSDPGEMLNCFLVFIVGQLRGRRATHAQDHVFAGISMAWKWIQSHPITLPLVDYAKTPKEVYVDFCKHQLEHMRRPVFLSMVGDELTERKLDLPSWVPDLSVKSRAPKSWLKRFAASGRGEHVAWRCIAQIDGDHLHIQGIYIDRLEKISCVIQDNMQPDDIAELINLAIGVEESTDPQRLVALLKALTFGNLLSGVMQYTEAKYLQDFRIFFAPIFHTEATNDKFQKHAAALESLFTSIANRVKADIDVHDASTTTKDRISMMDQQFQAVSIHMASNNRRIAISSSQHRLATVPKGSKAGDELWLLSNAALPFVLRKKSPTASEYEVIGEAFVDGCSSGEILERTTNDEYPIESITLV